MTDKEKAQAYDNVVNKLKKFIQQGVEPLITKNDVQDFFPELAESNSEDERIRKSLIRNFTNQHSSNFPTADGFTKEQILAWLEKQGNQTIFNTPSKETILAIWELGNDWKELTNGVISTEHGTQLDYIQKHWSESEHYLREKRKHEPAFNEQQGKSALKSIHEQKPNNKPKFKVGDWIIFAENHNSVYQVERIYNYRYYLRHYLGGTLSLHFDNELIRLWTLQDAKDGDILVSNDDGRPFMFKGCLDPNHPNCPVAYCGIDTEDMFLIGNNCWWNDGEVQPATKEQRDLLFQKMHKAGYELDAERKQLKKIENHVDWSEEDEYQFNTILHNIDLKKRLKEKDGKLEEQKRYQHQYDWLQRLKNRVILQPKEWSEEDDYNL